MIASFINHPAIISSLGEGLKQHIEKLLANQSSPLQASDCIRQRHQIDDDTRVLGVVDVPLRPFDSELALQHHSRNNQLVWHAMAQIEDILQKAIARFGAHRIAVIIGTSTTGVDENIPVFKYESEHPNDWSGAPFNQQQQFFSAPADFLAAQYGLGGPTYGISTACTSGAKALMSAARLLNAGLCDAVLCGGVDTLSPLTVKGFNSLSVLNKQRSNPFSVNRNGINIGEGAALFVLSREQLSDSNIQLLGYGASSDAYHMSSPHPEGRGAIEAFQTALQNAAIDAASVGWINLHGTGTQHNDQMEALTVNHVFGAHTPCTSTKPYTGHTLGAAGAIEAALCYGMIDRRLNPQGKLPAQLWDKQTDNELATISLTDEQSCWPQGRRIAASSSFAFGGNNAVLILGEAYA